MLFLKLKFGIRSLHYSNCYIPRALHLFITIIVHIQLTVVPLKTYSQCPEIIWEKNYGGPDSEVMTSITSLTNGNLILGGWSYSSSGDVSNNNGVSDFWVIKTDNNANLIWEKNFGTSDNDLLYSIINTSDNNILLGGYTLGLSTNGLVVKIDQNGNILWEQNYKDVFISCMIESLDGNILLGGSKYDDYYLIKVDQTGNILWEKEYGGISKESFSSMVNTQNGNILIGGSSDSKSGDVSDNNGSQDYWALLIDQNGNILWENNYGGSESDGLTSITNTLDGNVILAGMSQSKSGDVSNNNGDWDFWVIKINQNGEIIWEKNYGGSDREWLSTTINTIDGNILLGGRSLSKSGDVSDNNGDSDFWVIKINQNGEIIWENNYGGSEKDFVSDLIMTEDGKILLGGTSSSKSGDVSNNNGTSDYWLVKLETSHQDYDALMSLYASTNGDNWTNNTGWKEGSEGTSCDPCADGWYGVICDTDNRVATLDLDGTVNKGYLVLDGINQEGGNQLNGTIPPEIGELSNLQFFSLSGNELSGSIPSSIGALLNLGLLNLADNQLNGFIPDELYNLNGLQTLLLANNNLEGNLDRVPQLGSLKKLLLSMNQMSGEIPDGICSLALVELEIGENSLTGEIPECLSQMNLLLDLYLSDNDLSGCIPDVLQQYLCNHDFSFVEIKNQKLPYRGDLNVLCSNSNQIGASCNDGDSTNGTDDVIQDDCSCGPAISDCMFSNYRELIGSTDNWFTTAPNEGVLFERYCGFPPSSPLLHFELISDGQQILVSVIVDDGTIDYFDCEGNLLASCISGSCEPASFNPLEFSSIISSSLIDEPGPGITGPTCDCAENPHPDFEALMALYTATGGDNWVNNYGWEEGSTLDSCNPCDGNWFGITCNDGRVDSITLINNRLSGFLPRELGQLNFLEFINLNGDNSLVGEIPVELGDLVNLKYLAISGFSGNNNLTGSIPTSFRNFSNIEILDLGFNALSGNLPDVFGSQKRINVLYLSGNSFSGSIPASIANLSSTAPFLEISLNDNIFEGSIPFGFGSQTNLVYLDLSNNSLSNCIPEDLFGLCPATVNLLNNSLLPWQGDISQFCATNGSQDEQVGAPCDDSDESNGTNNDVIQTDCSCRGERSTLTLPYCEDANLNKYCLLSELDGIQTFTQDSSLAVQTDQPSALCGFGGSVPNNMSWFAFVAGSNEIEININYLACYNSDITGIDASANSGVYDGCNDGECLVFLGSCNTGADTSVLYSDQYVIGQTYYLFIDGCADSFCEFEISITNPQDFMLAEPEITCDNITSQKIDINWLSIPGAIGYNLTIVTSSIGTLNEQNIQALSYQLSGLSPNEEITITVEAISVCGSTTTTLSCITDDCQLATIDLTSPTTFCYQGDSLSLEVDAMSNNGVNGTGNWSGPGVAQTGFFAPTNLINNQTYEVLYTFLEDNGCMTDTSFTIEVFIESEPSFSIAEATLCPGQEINLALTSSLQNDETISWDFGELQISSGTDEGPYTLWAETAGTYTITNNIENGTCISTANFLLEVTEIPTTFITETICAGDTYQLGSQLLSEAGNYEETYTAISTTCDSIVNLDLVLQDYFSDPFVTNLMVRAEDLPTNYNLSDIFSTSLPDNYLVAIDNSNLDLSAIESDGLIELSTNTDIWGEYIVGITITNLDCPEDIGSTSLFIQVENQEDCLDPETIFVPSGMTPNDDGKNDYFIIDVINKCENIYTDKELTIYSRWGVELFHAAPYNNDWDGANLPEGVYYYVLELDIGNGIIKQGHVTIIR